MKSKENADVMRWQHSLLMNRSRNDCIRHWNVCAHSGQCLTTTRHIIQVLNDAHNTNITLKEKAKTVSQLIETIFRLSHQS
jgi:hypothetical protein